MAENSSILTFEQFINDGTDTVFKERTGKKAQKIGWFCTYIPEEIITAAGFIPYRIAGINKTKKAEGYFPINFCPFVKSSMEDLLENVLGNETFFCLIFTNSCDCMRRFYDVARNYLTKIPAFLLDVPRNRSELAIRQFINNIKKLISFLEDISKKNIRTDWLEDAVCLHNEKRAILNEIESTFIMHKGFTAANYFKIMNYAMTEEPGIFTANLKKYLGYIKNAGNVSGIYLPQESPPGRSAAINKYISKENRPPVMIVGNFIQESKLWEIFDDLDCFIACTDTCSAGRYFKNVTGLEKDCKHFYDNYALKETGSSGPITEKILTDIAVRQLFKPQCMRMADLGKKIEEINKNIDKYKIKGIIFISQKFCDNTLLFYPLLRQDLNKLKIPSLFLEIEHNNLSAGQVKTRIQAFLEIL